MSDQKTFENDTISTNAGAVQITFLGHGSLMFAFNGRIIHVDPFSRVADYTLLPKADLILITHAHGDHLDLPALASIRTEKTQVVLAEICAAQVAGGLVMKNGDVQMWDGVRIEAVPAYNQVHLRGDGLPFHPKGEGNGYVLTFGDTRIYIAGDTEDIAEMKTLGKIDCAFLPMNLPYTMTPEMAGQAARSFHPKVVYPYHYGDTDPTRLVKLLEDEKGIEVRVRQLA